MFEYGDWFSDKTRLNAAIARLNHVKDQMPSVHNDSIPVGESSEVWAAINAIERAIHILEPLRKYKKPLPSGEVE